MKNSLFAILAFASAGLLSAQCEGAHEAMDDQSWLSCTGTQNPNTSRTEEHWILYDFGSYYFLNESHFWNYNQAGETANGMATVAVDYSVDGESWDWWGDLNLDEAPGSDEYYGEVGPDFEGLLARYLLLTVVSNHGGPCYGFSEMKIDVDPGVLDVEEPSLQAFQFGVYPNPATDFARLQLEGGAGSMVDVYSPTGELVLSLVMTSESARIDVNDFVPGLYLLEVETTDGSRATQRLTVVK